MRVLVTGATGFLGLHVCRRLVAQGHSVTILRRASSNTGALAGLALRHEIGEITDPGSTERAARGQDAVIHAAAHRPHWGDPEGLEYEVNVRGTQNVVDACIRNRVGRLLHVSSVAAVGIPDEPTPADEDFPFNLERSGLHYHISKRRAEDVVMAGVARGLDAVIVNPTGIYGPAGSFYRGGEMIQKVRGTRVLRCFSGGICIVHVEDVTDGLLAALNHGVIGQRYILGGENLTYRTLMEKTANAIGVKRWFVPLPAIVTGMAAGIAEPWGRLRGRQPVISYADHYYTCRFSFYDSGKARRILGFRPRAFDAILEDCVRFLDRLPSTAQ